jgi:hypothetical protein
VRFIVQRSRISGESFGGQSIGQTEDDQAEVDRPAR